MKHILLRRSTQLRSSLAVRVDLDNYQMTIIYLMYMKYLKPNHTDTATSTEKVLPFQPPN